MSNDKLMDRLKKLLALARRGVGGEKDNAQRFLDKLLAKHGMTLADLADERVERFEFRFKDQLEHKLLLNVICHVLQDDCFSVWKVRGKSRMVMVDMTKAQKIEVDTAFATYRAELAKNINRMFTAFILTNGIGIYGPRADQPSEKPSTLSPQDIAAIRGMMNGMERTAVRRAITQ